MSEPRTCARLWADRAVEVALLVGVLVVGVAATTWQDVVGLVALATVTVVWARRVGRPHPGRSVLMQSLHALFCAGDPMEGRHRAHVLAGR